LTDIQNGLLDPLAKEKKRRKRGKKLNLVVEEDSGAQLFHSSMVQAAKAYAAEKEAKEEAEKAEKEAKKSPIVVLPYKKTSISSIKAATFAGDIEVVTEEEGSKMVTTRTRRINLPERFKHK
jgi:hypothetical protein